MSKDVFELHKNGGALDVTAKLPVTTKEELSLAYTPGIAKLCSEIEKNQRLPMNIQ